MRRIIIVFVLSFSFVAAASAQEQKMQPLKTDNLQLTVRQYKRIRKLNADEERFRKKQDARFRKILTEEQYADYRNSKPAVLPPIAKPQKDLQVIK